MKIPPGKWTRHIYIYIYPFYVYKSQRPKNVDSGRPGYLFHVLLDSTWAPGHPPTGAPSTLDLPEVPTPQGLIPHRYNVSPTTPVSNPDPIVPGSVLPTDAGGPFPQQEA